MKPLVLLMFLFVSPLVNAELYKSKDAAGNVTYSDVPPVRGQSEPVDLPPLNVMAPTPVSPKTQSTRPNEEKTATYSRLTIASPVHDSAIRENTGQVDVKLDLSPALNVEKGDTIVILLDGEPFRRSTMTEISLLNVDRGTHTLSAAVTDRNGNMLVQTEPITFHLQRFSKLLKSAH